jgi:hypothetical protein
MREGPSSTAHAEEAPMRLTTRLAPLAAVFAIAACEETPTTPTTEDTAEEVAGFEGALFAKKAAEGMPKGEAFDQSPIEADFSAIDARLAEHGLAARLGMIEYITVAGYAGRTVLASDRGNKRLLFHFVPGDPRRFGSNAIFYAVDETEAEAFPSVPATATEPAMDRAMATWNGMTCSTIPIAKVPSGGVDLGVVQLFAGFGGSLLVTDYMHAGWLPPAFFNTEPFFPPDGADFIVGATFTFGLVDGAGDFTDVNNDGRLDAAFRETYYNNGFPWGIDTNVFPFVDVESIVYHEAGHGLSQGHFGDIFTDGSGRCDLVDTGICDPTHLHFAPRAVMNATYSGLQQAPTGTDTAGHCSIWGSWPNN